jgi:hypothetical protein
MNMHIDVLFNQDERTRLVSVNQWNGGTTPRFFLGRTDKGNTWRYRSDLAADLIDQLEALCLQEVGDPRQEPVHKKAYVALLAAHQEPVQLWQGPAYCCPKPSEPLLKPTLITPENAHLLEGGLDDWRVDVPYWQPFSAIIHNDHAVAVCASVRQRAFAHEAGVETLSAYRAKGYAVSAVAGWANTLRSHNIMPLYSTSWDNKASQGIARKLGFEFYGTDFHIT